ncbi:MAG: prolipoprotein diacylglyceryl transferase [Bradymonadaceae bacterium]
MHPTLFDSAWIGLEGALHFTISSYFAAILLGFVLASAVAYRDVRRLGMSHAQFVDFAIWMLIIGVLGSRVMHVLVDGFLWDYIHLCLDPFALEGKSLSSGLACHENAQCLAAQSQGGDIGAICGPEDGLCYPQRDCFRWVKFWAGGLTVYGGVLGCAAFAWFYLKKTSISVAKMMDIGGYGIFLGLAIGRLGCWGAGCCFGGICDIEWLGVQFPVGSLAYQHHFEEHYIALRDQWNAGTQASLAVYPTQLISSLNALMIFLVAFFFVRPRKRFDGQVMLTSVILYGATRFGIEFMRDDARGGFLSLSTSQWVSLPLFIGGIIVFVYLWRKSRPVKELVDEEEA